MKQLRRILVSLILLIACAAGVGSFSRQHSTPKTRLSPEGLLDGLEDHLASRILGRQVENEDGQELAKIDDLLFDLRSGEVKFALLGTRGFLGLSKCVKPVPWHSLSLETTKKYVVALDITNPGWEQAPVLKREAAGMLSRPALASSIDRYYQQAAQQNDLLTVAAAAAQTEPSPTPVGRESLWLNQSQAPGYVLKSFRSLIEKPVLNNRQQQTGCLIDVLVESSRPHQGAYAIISANRLLNHVEHFAVPLQLLNEDERRWLVVDANRESFEQAKPFDLTNREDHRKQVGRMFRLSPDRSLPAADTSTTKPDDVMVTKEITTASDGF